METARSTILLLDDDHFFRELLAMSLSEHGYVVVQARSAKLADVCLAQRQPALVVVDYKLPGMDGVSWIQEKREQGVKTPMILLSGLPIENRVLNLLRGLYGVGQTLRKPVDIDFFVQQVEAIVPLNSDKKALPQSANSYEPDSEHVSISVLQDGLRDLDELEFGAYELDDDLEEGGEEKSEVAASEENESIEAGVGPLLKSKTRLQQNPQFSMLLDAFLEMLSVEACRLDALLVQWTNTLSPASLGEAMSLAHRFRGSSGSYGMFEIGHAAGKIEDLLLDVPSAPTREVALAAYGHVVSDVMEMQECVSNEIKMRARQKSLADDEVKVSVHAENEPALAQAMPRLSHVARYLQGRGYALPGLQNFPPTPDKLDRLNEVSVSQ